MLKIFVTVVALISLPAPAGAEIYKCRLANGQIEIANTPCPSGSGTVMTRPDEHVPEASRRQAEREVERMRSYVEKREAIQRATEETAAREERAASQRQRNIASPAPLPARHYGSADECLSDVGKMALEATERARMEADCHNIANPQTVYVPVGVPSGPPPLPHHIHPEPMPKIEPTGAPKISMPLLQK